MMQSDIDDVINVSNPQNCFLESRASSGKSSQLPWVVACSSNQQMICTVPRRVVVVSLATCVAKHGQEEASGEEIG